jgi:hypothetical protein
MTENQQSVSQNKEASTGNSSAPQVEKKIEKPVAKNSLILVVVALVIVIAGVGSGWFLFKGKISSSTSQIVPGAKSGVKEAGLADEKTFRDTASGTLEEGGVNGEGTHHLVREGGPSQNVYLTSTVIDLQSFVGKKVQVWGETIGARKAGWLMDVGKVKVIE